MINSKVGESQQVLPGIIGNDPAIHRLAHYIRKIAGSDRTIFLRGATGTGKELFANAIHHLSQRKGTFVAVNCSAIPENLFESLLFGHEKGSFTGADKSQHGFFAQADHGTLFLDEVAELSLPHQSKLLRVLETRRFRQIGSQEEITFTGRIITATHANMKRRVEEKRFREDLFYRLNVFELEIPSLEQRRSDIPLLANHFARQMGNIVFSQCALELFKYSKWPGNIRQLKNTIDKISVLAESNYLSARTLQEMAMCQYDHDLIVRLAREIIEMPFENKLKAIEGALVSEAVTMCNGNKAKAARLLGVHRKVIERRLFQLEGCPEFSLKPESPQFISHEVSG